MKFKSTIIAQASGSLNGLTFSHNRGGMYIRNRSIPTNPGTALQAAVRNYFSSLAKRWQQVLTASQRQAWSDYGTNVPIVDALGEPRNLTGLQHYLRSNTPRLQAGLDVVDDGPTVYSLPAFQAPVPTASEAAQKVSIAFNNGDDWANEDDAAMLVLGSDSLPGSINYHKGPYNYLGKIEGDSVTPPTSPTLFDPKAPFVAGQKVFVQARVTRADGRLSEPFRLGVTCAA